jgi:hypothetical protein
MFDSKTKNRVLITGLVLMVLMLALSLVMIFIFPNTHYNQNTINTLNSLNSAYSAKFGTPYIIYAQPRPLSE